MTTSQRELEIVLKAKDLVSSKTKKISASVDKMKVVSKRAFKVVGAAAKKAGRAIKVMLAPITKVTTALGLLSGVGLGAMIKSAAEGIDTIGKFSDRLGLTTEFLSEMRHVADISGVKVEALNVGFQRVTRRMAEFASTGGGAAANAIRALGLEDLIKQGKTIEEILPEMTDGFANLGTDAERVSAAFGLFDSEGVSFLQFLNQGKDEIARLREEAHKLGIVIGDEAAKKAANFNDQFAIMLAAFRGLKFSFGLAFFDDLASSMRDVAFWIAENREAIVGFVKDAASVGKNLAQGIGRAIGDEGARDKLGTFVGKSMLEIFNAAGKTAAIGFSHAFGLNLEVHLFESLRNLGAILEALSSIPGLPDFKGFGSGLKAASGSVVSDSLSKNAQTVGKLWTSAGKAVKRYYSEFVGQEAADKAVDATKQNLSSSGAGGSGATLPLEQGGFFGLLIQGFTEQADRMKQTFQNIAGNAAVFASDSHRVLSRNFFDLAKRDFKDFAKFVTDTFNGIIDSILQILSDMLASQVISGFASIFKGILPSIAGAASGASFTGASNKASFGAPSFDEFVGSSGGGFSSNESGRGETYTFNINAIDGASVAGFVEKHGITLASGLASTFSQNNGVKTDFQGAIS